MAKNETIRQIVEQMYCTYGTTDPFLLCKRLRITVKYRPLEKLNGFLYTEARRAVITLNSDTHEIIQRVTCAHELGHYVLGHDSNRIFLSTHTYQRTDSLERDANTFAAELLGYNGDDSELAAMSCCEEHIAYIVEELVRLKQT